MQGAYYGAYDMERTNPVICTTWHDLSVGYTMAVVIVVDARNEVPGIDSRYYAHDDIRVHMKGACFAIHASPPTTLGWPGLQ